MIVDTGPLVAYFDRRERAHGWVAGEMAGLRPPLYTCEAVLTESCFLLQRVYPDGIQRLRGWLERELLTVPFQLSEGMRRPFDLMHRYANLPMSLADACLVHMIEIGAGDRIFTLDQHFRIYRHSGRRAIPVLMLEV